MADAPTLGTIRFFQACLPPLPPGDYEAHVRQTVNKALDAKEAPDAAKPDARDVEFEHRLNFSAAGPRFFLNPSDVYSVYPPAGDVGGFDSTLPHVVFTRRTVPWERTLSGDHDPTAPCPWMALLVLRPDDAERLYDGPIAAARERGDAEAAARLREEKDAFPAIRGRTVGELLEPKEPDVVGPTIVKAIYEKEGDLCNTLDLPGALVREIVPAKEDLPYLAHVRSVETDDKETLSYLSEGWFSVVLANRFPQTALSERGEKNTACLVSLEGYEEYLHGGSGELGNKKIRLAVLASWVFTCKGKSNFKSTMRRLDDGLPMKIFKTARKIRWRIVNPNPGTARVDRIALEWPRENGALQGIELDGATIAERPPVLPDSPPGLSRAVVEAGWQGEPSVRELKPGASPAITLLFEKEPGEDARRYRFQALFAEGGGAEYRKGAGASGLLTLPLPSLTPEEAAEDGFKAVVRALEQGYSGVNHTLRIGEKTVSWYRGPLVPLQLAPNDPYRFYPYADQALRYDENRLFDVSYAAAWQLGRLLALQNRPFAQALKRYRQKIADRAAAYRRRESERERYGVADELPAGESLVRRLLELLPTSLARPERKG